MKNFTRILSATSLVIMMSSSVYSQDVFKTANVGIGNISPTQKLDVAGNVKFSGALMPNNLPGTAGNILLSAGIGVAPTWLANGSSGQILTANASGIPTWTSVAAATNAWNLVGNSISATYGANFIGTINSSGNQPLEFYANNAYYGVLDNANTNVYFGQGSGGDSTSIGPAAANIAIGREALRSASTGTSGMVAIGYDALYNFKQNESTQTITPQGTEAVGAYALYNLAAPTGPNEAFGYKSGYNFTTGSLNISEGYVANYWNQTGTANVAVGDSAMFGGTGAVYTGATGNTALGVSSLSSVNTGVTYNTAVGYESELHNTTGNYNVGVGYRANYANTGSNYNTAVGYNALYANVSHSNTAVGASSLKNNTTGTYNTALGDSTLATNTVGYRNVAVGTYALTSAGSGGVTSDTANTAIGEVALEGLTSGSDNVALGAFAGNVCNPSFSVIIGFSAFRSTAAGVSPQSDVGIGAWAMESATGSFDVGIGGGASAAGVLNGVSGNNDIGIGYQAGLSLSSGSNNIAIGTSAVVGTTQSGNTAIGNAASATGTAGTTANNTALGASANASGSANATAIGEGSTASGTSNSTALGAGASATAANATAIGAGTTAGTANTVILGTGTTTSVGIGTSTPVRLLEVAGTTNTIRVDGLGAGNTFGNTAPSAATDQIMYAKSTGDIYSMPNGTTGYALTIVGGIPTWAPAAAPVTATLPLTVTSNNILLSGTSGGVLYGLGVGTGSAFTSAGPLGEVLEGQGPGQPPIWTTLALLAGTGDNWGTQVAVTDSSNDAGTPESTITGNGVTPLRLAQDGAAVGQVLSWNGSTWKPSSGNASLTTASVQNGGGSSVVFVTNGSNQVVNSALGNVSIDVQGASGEVLYGKGASISAAFTTGGSAGQVLELTAGVPTWSSLSAGSGWALTGNSGTTPGTNFLGTLDDEPLQFEVNNSNAGSVDGINNNYTNANTYLGAASTLSPVLPGAGNNDAGSDNVGIGLSALASAGGKNSSSTVSATNYNSYNVAVGVYALSSDVLGSDNVAVGAYSQRYANFGNGPLGYDVAVGSYSLYSNSTGQYNTALGYYSMFGSGSATAVGNFNTAEGYNSLYTAGAGMYSNTAIGSNALYNNSGNRNTAVGDSALYSITTGTNNTAIGYQANVTLTSATNATVIGYGATSSTSNSITLGNPSVSALYLPGYTNVGDILYTSTGAGLVTALTPGSPGTVLSSQGPGLAPTWIPVTGVNSVTGTPPIYVNNSTPANPIVSVQGLNSNEGGVLYSTGTGSPAAFNSTGTSGYVLTSTGTTAPTWLPPSSATGAWNLTGNAVVSGNFLGTTNDISLEFEVDNVNAGSIDPLNSGYSNANTYFGGASTSPVLGGAGNSDAGQQNVGIGLSALGSAGGANETYMSGYGNSSTLVNNDNIAIGAYALSSMVYGANSVAVGAYSQRYANYASGEASLSGIGNGNNTSVGTYSLYSNSTGQYNTALGYYSMYGSGSATAQGNFNTSGGYQSLYTAGAGEASNTALGSNSLYNTIASRNTAVGDSALAYNSTGTNNTALGYNATVASNNLINATVIGSNAVAYHSNTVILGDSMHNVNVGIGTGAPATDAGLGIRTLHIETRSGATATSGATDPASGNLLPLTPTISGNDVGGNIQWTEGSTSTPTSGAQVQLFFAVNYPNSYAVIITPANSQTAAIVGTLQPYVTLQTSSGFTISFAAGSPVSGTPFSFNYFVIETQ